MESTKDLINDLVGKQSPRNDYLHVEKNEIVIRHGDVLADANGSKWLVDFKTGPAVQFIPLYRTCELVSQDGNSTSVIHTEIKEPEDKEGYDATDLGLITQNAIDEELASLKPIVARILMKCVEEAQKQKLGCEAIVDLGGCNSIGNKKAQNIEKLLTEKGFKVKWHMGNEHHFQGEQHVFHVNWELPDRTKTTAR